MSPAQLGPPLVPKTSVPIGHVTKGKGKVFYISWVLHHSVTQGWAATSRWAHLDTSAHQGPLSQPGAAPPRWGGCDGQWGERICLYQQLHPDLGEDAHAMLLLHFTWLRKAEERVLLAPDTALQGLPKTPQNSWFQKQTNPSDNCFFSILFSFFFFLICITKFRTISLDWTSQHPERWMMLLTGEHLLGEYQEHTTN